MAKTIPLSLFGFRVSGDLGGLTIYTNQNGRKVAYNIAPPKEPVSVRQQLNRNRFIWAAAKWRALSQGNKKALEDATRRTGLVLTGQNLWISASMRADQTGFDRVLRDADISTIPLIITPPVVAPIDSLLAYSINVTDEISPWGGLGANGGYLQQTSPPDGWGDMGWLLVSPEGGGGGTGAGAGTGGGGVATKEVGQYFISLVITRLPTLTRTTLDVHVSAPTGRTFHKTIIKTVTTGWPDGGGSVSYVESMSFGELSLDIVPQWPPV